MSACRKCAIPISRCTRTGLCRPCMYRDADYQSRRLAAQLMREADPELIASRRAHIAALNRTPEARERSRLLVSKVITPEARRRGGRASAEKRLEHIPPAYREMYRGLRKYGLKPHEALGAVEQQFRVDQRRKAVAG